MRDIARGLYACTPGGVYLEITVNLRNVTCHVNCVWDCLLHSSCRRQCGKWLTTVPPKVESQEELQIQWLR